MKVKALSWNIWCDGHFTEIADFLKFCDADVIGLQEVLPHSTKIPVIDFLTELGYEHVYFPVMEIDIETGGKEELGNAIFSKYPIVKSVSHKLSEKHMRIAGQADIDIAGTMAHVFCAHLKHTHQKPLETQDLQMKNLIKALPGDHVVVMGDFNATPESRPVKMLEAVLINTDKTSTPTWSVYPEGCTVCKPQAIDTRLDYIFVSKDMKASSFKVESSKGSDHLPISVSIQI